MNNIQISFRYEPMFELLGGDNSQVDTVIVTGGRYSQKSFATGLFACVGAKDYGYNILYTRYTLTSAQDSIIPEFNEKLDMLNCYNEFNVTKDRIEGENSKIVFKGIKTSAGNQTAALKSLKGFNCWIYDEAEEHPDFDSWDKIQKSIRSKDKRNLSILLLNPATKASWLYKYFFEDRGVEEGFNGIHKNVLYIHTTYLDLERDIIADNIWNDFEEKRIAYEQWITLNESDKEISQLKKNALYYKHTILGGWLNKAEGVIFENWKVGEFVDTGYSMYGADFGFSNDPNTLVYTSVDNKNKKIYVKELLYRPKLKTSELFEIYKHHCGNNKIIADSAEPRLIEELKDLGINITGAIKGQGSVTAGIAKLLDYELIIDPNSKNTITELNNYVWNDKTTKDVPIDKYNHCFIGNTLITTDEGLKPIKDIKVGDLVLTRKGYKKVLKKFNNGVKKVNKYSMQSDTFSVYLCSTKEHKILSETWKEISKLQSGEMVYQHKHSTDLFLYYIQKNDISRGVQKECTFTYGNITMVKDQKDIIYIIKMKMLRIIDQKTWNVLKRTNTLASILKLGLKKIKNGLKNFMQKELNLQKNGISQKKVDNGILNMEKECGLTESTKTIIANNVEKNLNQDILELSSIAITTAKLKHLEIGESWSEEVYDIMVDECHEYFANGILVHNCLDALRYSVSELIEPEPKLSGSMASYFGL